MASATASLAQKTSVMRGLSYSAALAAIEFSPVFQGGSVAILILCVA